MMFIHADPAFDDLLGIVAEEKGMDPGLVEKDYWVTHTLWALQNTFEIWFKGGTSLSKGFDLIRRFSEDIDVRVEGGGLPSMTKNSWSKKADKRQRYFEELGRLLIVPDATVQLQPDVPEDWKNIGVHVEYPVQRHQGVLKPYVLLEAGLARTTPFVAEDLSSFVHDYLETNGGLSEFEDNRPRGVRCVHPWVTLLEKLEAISRNFAQDRQGYARHFEDAARIIQGNLGAPPDFATPRQLADAMVKERDLKRRPEPNDPAFAYSGGERWNGVRNDYAMIETMFWGPRLSLGTCCEEIRAWLETRLAA
jgi:hypothetical protein